MKENNIDDRFIYNSNDALRIIYNENNDIAKSFQTIKKAFNEGKISLEVFQKAYNNYIQKAKRANIGEIRHRKGGKYKKVGEGKWVPVRDQANTKNQEEKVESISENDLFNYFDEYKDNFKEVEKVKKGMPALKDIDTKTLISAVGDTPTERNEINDVHIQYFGDNQNGTLQLSVKSKDFFYNRFLYISNGKLESEFENDAIEITKTGEGVGTKTFANQVVNAKKMGFDSIFCRAADQLMGDYNGYYTWARLGYDFDRDYEKNRFRKLLDNSGNDVLKACQTLPQLMTLPEGQKFWKENGFAFKGRFNLADDSESMKLFSKYYDHKFGLQKAIVNDIEKGKRAQVGEIRNWKGGRYQKTAQGWKPVKEDKKEKQGLKVDKIEEKDLFNYFDEYKEHFQELEDIKNKDEVLKNISLKDLVSMAGGVPDENIEITKVGASHDETLNDLRIMVKADGYRYSRTFEIKGNKIKSIYNGKIDIEDKGKGLGSKIFANQVYYAKKNNVEKITCFASGGPDNIQGANGYYTWARLGYDFNDEEDIYLASKAKFKKLVNSSESKEVQACQTLPQLMSLPEGRELWKKKGFSFEGKFDLSDNSESMRIFNKYYKEKF